MRVSRLSTNLCVQELQYPQEASKADGDVSGAEHVCAVCQRHDWLCNHGDQLICLGLLPEKPKNARVAK